MKIDKTAIEGLLIITPKIFKDDRGYFLNLITKRHSMRWD